MGHIIRWCDPEGTVNAVASDVDLTRFGSALGLLTFVSGETDTKKKRKNVEKYICTYYEGRTFGCERFVCSSFRLLRFSRGTSGCKVSYSGLLSLFQAKVCALLLTKELRVGQ